MKKVNKQDVMIHHKYKGRAKCCCGVRAKYRVITSEGNNFSCGQHLSRVIGLEVDDRDNSNYSEADHQTWLTL